MTYSLHPVDDLLRILRARSLREGDFELRSGGRSSWYVDGKQATFSAEGALAAGRALFAEAERMGATAVGGMTLGADPLAVAAAVISALEGRPLTAFSVRTEVKHHGAGGRIVGPLRPEDRALIVEDVTTTGGAMVGALDVVRAFGCEVVGAAVLLARSDRPAAALAARGVRLRSLYTAVDFGK